MKAYLLTIYYYLLFSRFILAVLLKVLGDDYCFILQDNVAIVFRRLLTSQHISTHISKHGYI